MAILGKHSKRKVISNFWLNYEHEKFDIDKYKRSEYANCLILIDEGYVYLESRTSTSKQNRLSSYTLFQSRKNDIDVIISVQLVGTIDIRYRQLIDVLISAKRTSIGFEYTYYNVITEQYSVKLLTFEHAKKYYQYYNTYEIIRDDKMIEDIQTQDEKNKILHQYAQMIINNHTSKRKINLREVKNFCFKNGIETTKLPSIILAEIEGMIE